MPGASGRPPESHALTLEAAAAAATIVGLCLSTFSWVWERRTRKRLEDERQRRIWSDISKVRGLMTDLEKDEAPSSRGEGRLQAEGKLSIMLRDLIREACLAERGLDLETVSRWRAAGKLGSDWQEHLATMLLTSNELGPLPPGARGYARADELPSGHAMKAPGSVPPREGAGATASQEADVSPPAAGLGGPALGPGGAGHDGVSGGSRGGGGEVPPLQRDGGAGDDRAE